MKIYNNFNLGIGNSFIMMKKNKKILTILLLSIIPCGLAQGITIIAIPWYFTENLNNSSMFSLWYGVLTFIGLFWGLYAGVMIDKINRKKILLYINTISSFIFVTIAASTFFFNTIPPILIFLGFATCSMYYMIFYPNLYAMLQDLVNQKEYIKINSIVEIQGQLIHITSALICALLLSGSALLINYLKIDFLEFEKWSIEDLFFLNSLLYLFTYIILKTIKYETVPSHTIPNLKYTIHELKTVLNFLIQKKDVLIYGICSQIIFAFLIVEMFTLLPLFVKNCLNETVVVFSFADFIYGLGAIIAGFITIKILKIIQKINFTILLIIMTGYAVFIMVNFHTIHIFFLSTLIIGVTNASARITRISYLFNVIPNSMIGRSNTIFNAINTFIRNILILIFSLSYFSDGNHVVIGYKIGIFVLIIFVIPLFFVKQIR